MAQIETLAKDESGTMEVYYDYMEDGKLKGGKLIMPVPKPEPATLEAMPPYNAYPLIDNGPSENRIDLVCVGDGYTADEMDVYLNNVQNAIANFFIEEPLDIYASYFNVHVVEVISNESGVDEPDYGIYRDTALDMTFNCSGIPRLLCVNYGKAWTAAENARDVDLVLALANSTRYGGAGYSKLSTLAGRNSATVEVALHEFGHSFAGLADEYHYGDGSTYTGPEPVQPNVSIYDAAEQLAQQLKWFLWLNLPEIDTFEGALYKQYGIYRPTENSKMSALDYPFGPVNLEQFIFGIYEEISPIDAVEPASDDVLPAATIFSVNSQTPATHALDVQWQIDGVLVPGANETHFCPENYLTANTVQTLTAKVADNTISVRDENKRQNLLTDQANWLVWKPSADFDDNGIVDTKDLSSMVTWWLSDKTDFDVAPPGGDGRVNFQDFSVLAAQWLKQ
ncbi:MAG: M64 family metallopeptidase [Planctomycetota bacterium]